MIVIINTVISTSEALLLLLCESNTDWYQNPPQVDKQCSSSMFPYYFTPKQSVLNFMKVISTPLFTLKTLDFKIHQR